MNCLRCDRPTAGTSLCDYVVDGRRKGCATSLAYAVANIGAYYEHAHPTDMRQLAGGDPAKHVDDRLVGGTPTMPATQIRYDAWATIVAWCRVHMEQRPQVLDPTCRGACLHTSCAEARRRRWPANTIGSMTHYLARQHRWTISQPWVDTMLDELLDVERRLCWLVDIPAPRWYAGRCGATDVGVQLDIGQPECTAELYATVEHGIITCPACGTRHDVDTRRDFLLNQAADILVTASVAASALAAWTDYDGDPGRLTKRISEWRDRDRLEVRDVTSLSGRDRHLYRLGDIQMLLAGHVRRKQTREVSA